MLTTNVKETKAGVINLTANPAEKPTEKKDGGFQSIFDRQTGKGRAQKAEAQKGGEARKALKGRHVARRDRLQDEKPEDGMAMREQPAELTEEQMEMVAETAASAIQKFSDRICEILQVSEEELLGAMQELGLQPADLLSPTGLNQLVLTVSGTQEPMELLTNEELYGNLQELLGERQELLEEAGEAVGISGDRFLEAVREAESSKEEPVDQIFSVKPHEGAEIGMESAVSRASEAPRADGGRMYREESHGEKGTGAGTGNLVLEQMLRDAGEQVTDVQAESAGETNGPDTEMIMRQIMDHMKAQLRPDVSSLEMQLHPASLGNLQVTLSSRGGAVTAQFFAQNETVKAALETQMIQLRESFEEQGIRVEAIEVSVQTQQFERNLEEQGRGRQEQQMPKSRGTRRIRMDEPLSQEELSALTEEERLTTEMMQAGGQTVDFTV